MGRPRKELDQHGFEQAIAMCRMHATAEEIAEVLQMSPDTLSERLKERGFATFPEFYKRHSGAT